METKYANFPPTKKELRDHFGYLSFNTALINLDIVGIKLVKKNEVVVITYRGNKKTGFIYDGDVLNEELLFNLYRDIPECYNDLEDFEKFKNIKKPTIEVLAPPKDNYVFINEMEILRKK